MGSDRVGPPLTWWTEVEVDGCAYVFVPTTERLLALNQTATLVWHRCDGSLSRDQLVAALVEQHGGSPGEVECVTMHALALLVRAGLLRHIDHSC